MRYTVRVVSERTPDGAVRFERTVDVRCELRVIGRALERAGHAISGLVAFMAGLWHR